MVQKHGVRIGGMHFIRGIGVQWVRREDIEKIARSNKNYIHVLKSLDKK